MHLHPRDRHASGIPDIPGCFRLKFSEQRRRSDSIIIIIIPFSPVFFFFLFLFRLCISSFSLSSSIPRATPPTTATATTFLPPSIPSPGPPGFPYLPPILSTPSTSEFRKPTTAGETHEEEEEEESRTFSLGGSRGERKVSSSSRASAPGMTGGKRR